MGVRLKAIDSLKMLIKEYYDGLFAAAAQGRAEGLAQRGRALRTLLRFSGEGPYGPLPHELLDERKGTPVLV